MEPADSIRKLGFSRWYERRLIEGHAWLISAVLCALTIAACLEELLSRATLERLLGYGLVAAAAGAVTIHGLVRYQQILMEAEMLGAHATCSRCGIYARFKLVSQSGVQCRKCGHEWRLIPPESVRTSLD